jgi:hypothetical protein
LSIGASALLSASLLLTVFAGTSLAATGSLTCQLVSGAPIDSIAFGAAGTNQTTTDPGTFQPGSIGTCVNSALPNNGVGGWSIVGGQIATLPVPTSTQIWFVMGDSANPGATDVSYTAADTASATVAYNLQQLSDTIGGGNPQLDDSPVAFAANAIGNGVGAGNAAFSTYSASSGTPTATGACTAAPGAGAPAATTGTATSTLTTSQGTTCRANFQYTVSPTNAAILNYSAFTVTDQSAPVTVWDASVACSPGGTFFTNGGSTGPTAVGAGTNVIHCVATNGTGVTGAFTATGNITPNGGGFFNATGGTGTITYTTNLGTSHTFSYTITALAPTIACVPGSGSIDAGSTVHCTFTANDPANVFVNWTTSAGSFTPATSVAASQTFTANSVAGPATIDAHWTNASGAHTTTFSYTIGVNGASCNPVDGSTIMLGSTIACKVEGDGPFSVGPDWTTSNSDITPTATTGTPKTFTAAATGTSTISVTWTDAAGAHGPVTFSYQIVNNITGGTCSWSPALTEPRGGGFVGPTTLTCTEGAKADFGDGFSFEIHKAPPSPGAGAVHFDTSKAPTVITAPSSLGLSVAYVNDTTLKITSNPPSGHTDNNNIEQFTIGNIFDKADAGTSLGTIPTTQIASTGAIGNLYFTSASASVTATATTDNNQIAGDTTVEVTLTTSSCPLQPGSVKFTDTGDTETVTNVAPAGPPGKFNLTFSPGLAHSHSPGQLITETVPNCNPAFPSIGTVVDTLIVKSAGTPIVDQGETNQDAANITIAEQAGAFIPAGTVCSGSISEPGVLFSSAPTIATSGGGQAVGIATLSGDRKSFTFTVTSASASATPATITISGIEYDVDATTSVAGDLVNVTIKCGALNSTPSAVANAIVGNSVTFTATTPTVFIGYNDQASGIITGTENVAGTFGAAGSLSSSGAAAFNQLTICTAAGSGATFTRMPWMVITKGGPPTTPSSNGLQLLDTTTHQGTKQAQGVLSAGNTCATFTFYSGSTTTPGQFVIVGGDAPNTSVGVSYNIAAGATVGPVNVVLTGLSIAGTTEVGLVTNAIKQFKSDVSVTAGTPVPFIAPGTIDQPGSDITIAATDPNDQFRTGEQIRCEILDSAFNINTQVFIEMANQNEVPVIVTTGQGLIAHLVLGAGGTNHFSIVIDQEVTAGQLGTIKITNIHYTTVTGATLGPVIVECSNSSGIGAAFDQFVSNATVGTAPVVTPPAVAKTVVSDAKGKTIVGPFNTSTIAFKLGSMPGNTANNIVTVRASVTGLSLALLQDQQHPVTVQYCWAFKSASGTWTGFNTCTSRIVTAAVGATGDGFLYISAHTPAWISVRARVVGNGSTIADSPFGQTVQIHWFS